MTKKYTDKSIRNQQLAAARAELKQFRHDVAKLKKSGLISNKYDARKIDFRDKSAKYLKTQIKKFGNVLSGNAKTTKIKNKKSASIYKKQGYAVKNDRVIVPVNENETVYSRVGKIRVVTNSGSGKITRLDLNLDKNDIAAWSEQLLNKKIRLSKNERLAFKFYGNNSYQTFLTTQQLLDYLENYPAIQNISADASKTNEVIENVVIFKIERSGAWEKSEYLGTEKHERQKERNRVRRERWFNRMIENEYNSFMDKRASYEKMRRENEKIKNPEKYELDKQKARERAKKSYLKNKERK